MWRTVRFLSTKHAYKAETKNLLNIVSKALYTEREIFLRELISNASDALEKVRQKQVQGESPGPLEISVTLDPELKTLTVEDTGIGMTREDLERQLGTIALSGSKEFQENENIIGQFGVGFYSAFMVGSRVTVESSTGGVGTRWSSEGDETYTLEDLEDRPRGSKVIVELKDDEFLDEARVREVLKKYSSFTQFPVKFGDDITQRALWTQREASDDEYLAFYRTFEHAWDTPYFWHHFQADAPLDIKALLYVPSYHMEKSGMGRQDSAISLYCRKVLIESPCKEIAPEWMRFVKGVVDSEDLPLSISREKSQDRRLLAKIQDVVVRKFLRFLADQQKDRDKYLAFYREFQNFLKEGVCHDKRSADIAKLLYFDSSHGGLTSFDEYISRSTDDKIYYLNAPSRELALSSPYFEKMDKECLFIYNTIDDFVMSNIGTYNNRKIVPVEMSSEKQETNALTQWILRHLGDRLEACTLTNRLSDSPAVLVDAESSSMRRMMLMVQQQNSGGELPPLPKQKLAINADHPVVKALDDIVKQQPPDAPPSDLALTAAHQLLDNALVAAGLMDDARSMLTRLNKLLELAIVPSSSSKDAQDASSTKQ